MRILASNPDTLGDLILRQPLYGALLAAGHELTLIVRAAAVPLVKYVAPGANVIELQFEPYADAFDPQSSEVEQIIAAAHAADPELLLIAPYRWTRFDERLAESLRNVKRAGMTGHLYAGNPHAGYPPASLMRFDILAGVDRDDHEIHKNAALAMVILGSPIAAIDPKLSVTPDLLSRAGEILRSIGLDPGGYWVACVSGTAHVSLKAWPAESWGQVLRQWAIAHNQKFLFVGAHDELPAAEAVRAEMGDVAESHTRVWMPSEGTLDELLGLTALSAGYVGHDTGPMHVAASLEKPVLAVFGGGHGLRFAPAVDPSVTLVVGVPCMNCGWICSFATSHCVKQIPVESVLLGAADLEAITVTGRECRVLEPGAPLLSQMVLESAQFARDQVRESGERGRLLAVCDKARQTEVTSERIRAARAESDAAALRIEVDAAIVDRETARTAARRSAGQVAALNTELDRAKEELAARAIESAALAVQLRDHVEAFDRLSGDAVKYLSPHAVVDNGNGPAKTDRADPEPVLKLRAQIAQLGSELQRYRPHYRRPLRQTLTEWIIGRRDYPARPPRPLPRVTVVLPTLNAAGHLRETLDSVITQNYDNVEFIVVDGASTDGTGAILEEYRPHIGRLIIEPDEGSVEAAAKGFSHATGDVLHLLFAGEVLESGALLRVAEHFSRHPQAQAMNFADVVIHANGWRFVPPRPAPVDVVSLLETTTPVPRGLFFRRNAYERLGRLRPAAGRAAFLEFWLRLDRRFRVRTMPGQVRAVRAIQASSSDVKLKADRQRVRSEFLNSFGAVGRLRCQLLHVLNRARQAADFRDRLDFTFDPADKALPPADAPPIVANQPICPISNRHPDRFLFSTRDTNGGDVGLHYVYFDSSASAALTYPPSSPAIAERLQGAIASSGPRPIVPPDDRFASPFRQFNRDNIGPFLMRLRSPYWIFHRPNFGITAADTLLEMISRDVPPSREATRVLIVGCFEGAVLELLKNQTRWTLRGTETNPVAAAVARSKGFTVWETPPLDAPLSIPSTEQFDLIFLDGQIEHFQDPVTILRRLRQLLLPGGRIVINQPNLDSKHVEIFGPTWIHWQPPFHRILTGRRGLRQLAQLAGLRLSRTKTITHPYRTCVSVQLRELGLGATVPTDAKFPDDIAEQGINLTGWSRLLWDWRGRGDYLYAVLETI